MSDHITILLFKLLKWWIKREYHYCDKDDRQLLCSSCEASKVVDWLDEQIISIKEWNEYER